MSHVTTVTLKITDLEALEEAGQQLGFLFQRGQKTCRTYYGENACDHALTLPGAAEKDYEIGVVKGQGGSYDLRFDSWGPGTKLTAKAGAGLSRLKQEYAVSVASKKARRTLGRQGFRLTRENLPTGNVRLRLRRG